MFLAIFVVVYIIGFLAFSRGCSFHNERPADKFWAGVLWPILLVYLLWMLWTKQATAEWTWKGRELRRSRRD